MFSNWWFNITSAIQKNVNKVQSHVYFKNKVEYIKYLLNVAAPQSCTYSAPGMGVFYTAVHTDLMHFILKIDIGGAYSWSSNYAQYYIVSM